jgi:hypothetical protein
MSVVVTLDRQKLSVGEHTIGEGNLKLGRKEKDLLTKQSVFSEHRVEPFGASVAI